MRCTSGWGQNVLLTELAYELSLSDTVRRSGRPVEQNCPNKIRHRADRRWTDEKQVKNRFGANHERQFLEQSFFYGMAKTNQK